MFRYSQSYVRDAVDVNVCPQALKFKFVDGLEENEDDDTKNAMFYGRYFEWHLLGATRDGVEPVFKQNKTATTKKTPWGSIVKDYRPAEEIRLIGTVEKARKVIKGIGLDLNKGEKQVHLCHKGDNGDTLEGHLDWVTNDFQNPTRQAIYDVKWTATKYDDRYNGWADFQNMQSQQFQATHYTALYYIIYKEWVPFYFLVFGKSGWVRVIQPQLTPLGLTNWEGIVKYAKERTRKFIATGWQATPEFNKCMKCGYFDRCPSAVNIMPKPEIFEI